jgi:glycerophosphoryl diester phosphodiesterase
MPFITLEGLVKLDDHTLAVCNDNNFPMSVGRHEREGLPDDNEIILLRFDRPLAASR